jgi:hypothetical protein
MKVERRHNAAMGGWSQHQGTNPGSVNQSSVNVPGAGGYAYEYSDY